MKMKSSGWLLHWNKNLNILLLQAFFKKQKTYRLQFQAPKILMPSPVKVLKQPLKAKKYWLLVPAI